MGNYQTAKPNKNGGLKTKTQRLGAKFLASYYRNPAKRMKLIVISGTTGKVTVAHFVHEILKSAEQRVAVLASDDTIKTTVLHKFLSDAHKAGATYAIVTAPLGSLQRSAFYGLPITVAALTDYIPGDKPSADQLVSQQTLFEMKPEIVVLNSDDLYFKEFSKYTGTRDTVIYGSDYASTVRIDNSKLYKKGTEANLAIPGLHFTTASFLTGKPIVNYMAAAAAIAVALGFRSEVIIDGISNYQP